MQSCYFIKPLLSQCSCTFLEWMAGQVLVDGVLIKGRWVEDEGRQIWDQVGLDRVDIKNSPSSISLRLCHCFGLGMGGVRGGTHRAREKVQSLALSMSGRIQPLPSDYVKSPEAISCLSPIFIPPSSFQTLCPRCSDEPSSHEPPITFRSQIDWGACCWFSSSVATPLSPVRQWQMPYNINHWLSSPTESLIHCLKISPPACCGTPSVSDFNLLLLLFLSNAGIYRYHPGVS